MRARTPRLKARIVAPAALAVLTGVGVAIAVTTVGSSAVAGSVERTATVTRGVVQSTVSGSGSLSPANQLEVSFGASGEVRAIYVKPGQHVSAGQLLAKIDPSGAEVDLAEARATLQSARDALASASAAGTTTTAAVVSGAGDRSGAAIRTIALTTDQPAPTDTTPAAATTPASATAQAAANAEALAKAKAKALAKAKADAAKAKADAKAKTKTAAPTTAASAGSGAAGGATSVASATAAVKSAELSVTKAEKALAATKLRAPMASTVAAVDGAVGDTVGSGSSASASSGSANAGSTAAGAGDGAGASSGASSGSGSGSTSTGFITLAQVSRFRMDVSLSESDIGKVKVGQAATVTVNAVAGVELAAHVERVGVLSSSSSSTGAVSYPVTLKLDQAAPKLKAGMTATADIVVAQASGLTVPSQALTRSTVTVVRDGKRTTQDVQTGVVGASATQILSGLHEGDTVVVRSASAAAGASASAGQAAATTGLGRGGGAFPGGGVSPGGGFGGGGPVLRGNRPGGAGP